MICDTDVTFRNILHIGDIIMKMKVESIFRPCFIMFIISSSFTTLYLKNNHHILSQNSLFLNNSQFLKCHDDQALTKNFVSCRNWMHMHFRICLITISNDTEPLLQAILFVYNKNTVWFQCLCTLNLK